MKKVKILIIILTIVLVLGCATFATLYFATDIFKSDKEKFYKYLSGVNLNEFINREFYAEYSEKMKNTKFEENSQVNINLETFQKKINIKTQKDIPNRLATTEVSVDNSNTLLGLARDNDIFGVSFNKILNGYITVENNNLQELAEKSGINNNMITSIIPDKIESKEVLNTEEIERFLGKYKNLILEQIPDDSYSKVKGQETTFGEGTIKANGYKLTITAEELESIIKTLLLEMENDEELFKLLEKTSEELTFEIYQRSFESLIANFDSEFDFETEAKISIIAYKDIKKAEVIIESEESIITVEIEDTKNPRITINLSASTNIEMIINKTVNTAEQEKWEAELNMGQASTLGDETSITAFVSIERQGLLESNSINNIIDISFAGENLFTGDIKYSSTTKFDDKIEIDELENKSQLKMNDLTEEQITTVTTNLKDKLQNETDNITDYLYSLIGLPSFILNLTPLEQVGSSSLVAIPVFVTVSLNNNLFSYANQQESQLLTQTNDQATEMFNATFFIYEGVQRGSAVKTLVSTIDLNNTTNLENKVECNKTITDIDSSKNYIVSFGKDSEGYINKAIIEEQ